jgi:hypothetical protein
LPLARRTLLAALACAASAAAAAPASATTLIDTGVDTSDGSTVCSWGHPDSATYGQTIQVPDSADRVLDDFSFFLIADGDQPVAITYRAFVYRWDGTKATGAAVWESPAPQLLELTATSRADPQELTVDTPAVELASGDPYVLFVSVSKDYEANDGAGRACFQAALAPYAAGGFRFMNDSGDEAQWTQFAWSDWMPFTDDLAFKATLSPPAGPAYAFDGFHAPIDNRDAAGAYVLNAVKAGAAVPVRFSLGGDHGLDVLAAGYPRSERIGCDANAEVDGVEQTVEAGAGGLSYSAGTDTYTYVWKTDRTWEDSCRQLVVRLADGTAARANFTFVR